MEPEIRLSLPKQGETAACIDKAHFSSTQPRQKSTRCGTILEHVAFSLHFGASSGIRSTNNQTFIGNSAENKSLGFRSVKELTPSFSIRLISPRLVSVLPPFPWAVERPGGAHKIRGQAIRLQSASKNSSSNLEYPSQKGASEVNRKCLIFKRRKSKRNSFAGLPLS